MLATRENSITKKLQTSTENIRQFSQNHYFQDQFSNDKATNYRQEIQQMADTSERVKQLMGIQQLADNTQPIQRAVSKSGYYTAAAANRSPQQIQQIDNALNTLDGLIPTAVQNATNGVADIPSNRTNTQNAYAANPTAAFWGSCVEEQLNALDQTWRHQVRLQGARPDYALQVGGIQTYADLTSANQAGLTGNHITGKLQTAGLNAGVVVAADVTYGNGQGQARQVENWRMAAFQARQRHTAARGDDGDWEDNWANQNPVPSINTIFGWTQNQCDRYVRNVP
jgi:hypothetical protein